MPTHPSTERGRGRGGREKYRDVTNRRTRTSGACVRDFVAVSVCIDERRKKGAKTNNTTSALMGMQAHMRRACECITRQRAHTYT